MVKFVKTKKDDNKMAELIKRLKPMVLKQDL